MKNYLGRFSFLIAFLVVHPSFAQETEEIPAPKSSLLKTAATREYNKPLYFDQIDNGLVLPPMELEYDLTQDQGKSLAIGNVILSDKTFAFALAPLAKFHPHLDKVISPREGAESTLFLHLPRYLIAEGQIEMVSRTGNVLWSKAIAENDFTAWAQKLDSWRKALLNAGVSAKEIGRGGVFSVRYALPSAGIPLAEQKDSFRFCVSRSERRSSTRLCSARYVVKNLKGQMVMGKVRGEPVIPRVLLQNSDAPLKQTLPVKVDEPTLFFAELQGGESYEFVALPNKLELMDIADTAKPSVLRIVAHDMRPTTTSILLNPDQYSKLTTTLGFEATIGDPRRFWAAVIRREDPKIYLPGRGGGIFKQRFELSAIPRAQSRLYLHHRTPTGTYADNIRLFGRKQSVAKVETTENSVNISSDNEFEWRFKATERGKVNRAYLTVDFQEKKYRSYFELYKGYPREISGRFSGVQTLDNFIVMGEMAYNQWFEDIFTWSNYWVSRQRWGVALKYFQSFNELKVNTATGATAPLSVTTADLKYRLVPGLWGRDETLGLLASYQAVTFDKLKAPMVGAGIFWARSMPKVFDDFLNHFPFMNYPKWVDVEFIYYASSLDQNVTLNWPVSLNFHGKILWSERYFGEAGFGIKRYSFQDKELNQKAELNTFYGTVGLGLNF